MSRQHWTHPLEGVLREWVTKYIQIAATLLCKSILLLPKAKLQSLFHCVYLLCLNRVFWALRREAGSSLMSSQGGCSFLISCSCHKTMVTSSAECSLPSIGCAPSSSLLLSSCGYEVGAIIICILQMGDRHRCKWKNLVSDLPDRASLYSFISEWHPPLSQEASKILTCSCALLIKVLMPDASSWCSLNREELNKSQNLCSSHLPCPIKYPI